MRPWERVLRDPRSELSPDDVSSILDEARGVLSGDPAHLELESEILVVGDTHGDLASSLSAARVAEERGLPLLFLGDYIDRGPEQLENLVYVLSLKLSRPDGVFLLRGNHEAAEPNAWYGFLSVVEARLGVEAYRDFLGLYSELPLTAVLGGEILAVHGGIPAGVESYNRVRKLDKFGPDPEDPMEIQLLWNDPSESVDWFAPSPRGPGIFLFGRAAAEEFLSSSGLKMLIRGHEFVDSGMRLSLGGLVATVFSCRYYGGEPAAAEMSEGGRIRVIPLNLPQ